MGDGLPRYVIDIEARQQDTDGGKYQVQQVIALDIKAVGEESGNEADEGLEQDCGKARCGANDEDTSF